MKQLLLLLFIALGVFGGTFAGLFDDTEVNLLFDSDQSGSPPSSSPRNPLPLQHPPRIRSTQGFLQACICNINGSCLAYNVVLKDKIFFICIYHDNNGGEGGGGDQFHRLEQITSMKIKHNKTGTVFDAITSSIAPDGTTTATNMSPWVTVESNEDAATLMIIRLQQVLPFWFSYKGSTIDIRGEVEVLLLGSTTTTTVEISRNMHGPDAVNTAQSTESYYLTAQLIDQPCQYFSGPSDTVSVSIYGGDSIAFACTCDLTNSCHDLNLGLLDTPPSSIRICIVPQQGNDETADIVGITQLRLEKGGPCGFPFDVVIDGAVSPLATIVDDDSSGTGGSMLVATVQLLKEHLQNPAPITVYGAAEVKLPDSQPQVVPLGTLPYAEDESAKIQDDPSNQPSELPSLSHRPTSNPTQSNAPTEEQTMRLEYCPCDTNGACLPEEQVILTSSERIINICFKAEPDSAQISKETYVATNLTIATNFTTAFEPDMNRGVIIGELPLEVFGSSVADGSAVQVLAKFEIRDGPDRKAIVGLTVDYRIEQSASSSPYCSLTTSTELNACACQCNDDNICVDDVVQTFLSRGKFC